MRERLNRAETLLRSAVARGAEVDLGRDIDPRAATGGSAWDDSRVVRAQVIESLLRDVDIPHSSAVRLTGARITEGFRLSHGRLSRPLRLDLCWIDDSVSLVDLTTAGIELVRCRLPALHAESVDIGGSLSVRESRVDSIVMIDTRVLRSASFEHSRIAHATTPFQARNLSVGGDLLFTGARLFTQAREVIHTERLRVDNALDLMGVRAKGSLIFAGAVVEGRVDVSDAVLRSRDDVAFDGHHLSAAGFRAHDVTCTGSFDLRHATIAGTVSFDGATLSRPGGNAVFAGDIETDRIEIERGARVTGRVSLPRGVVRDSLSMRGITLSNPGGQAVFATGAQIGTIVADDATVAGQLVFDEIEAISARLIGATVTCADGSPSVSFQSASIRRDLNCEDLVTHGTLDLKTVRVGAAISLGGAQLDGAGGRALAASRAVVGERLIFGERFVARGDIDLAHVDVGKSLAIDGASVLGTIRLFQARVRSDVLMRGTYIESGGMGVDAIGLHVDGRLTARGLVCDGAVRLTAAVADSVVLTGAQIHNPDGNAVIASRIDVRGDLVAGDDPYSDHPGSFWAEGRVVLRDAHVGGDLVFDGAVLQRPRHRVLDATGIQVGGKVSFERVTVSGTVALDQAQVRRRIVLSEALFTGHGVGSAEGPIAFSALKATSEELLIDRGEFLGGVRLTGSSFAAGLSIRHAMIVAPNGVGLLAGDLTCGVVRLTEVQVYGAVVLSRGQIGGDVLVEGGKYRHGGRVAIDAAGVSVAGTLALTGSEILGTFVLNRAEVGLVVLFTDSRIADGAEVDGAASATGGQAVAAAGLKVGGNVECRGLTSVGQFSLAGAVVTGRLIFHGPGALHHPGRTALYAPGIEVDAGVAFGTGVADDTPPLSVRGDVRLDRSTLGEISFLHMAIGAGKPGSTDGTGEQSTPLITLREATVSRRLSMDGLEIAPTSDSAPPATIDLAEIRAGSVELPQSESAIDLRDAEIRSLALDPADTRTVLLSGLSFDDPGGADVDTALQWLRRDPSGYQHQVYEQLAAHYRRLGDDQAARTVLLERQRHRRDLLRHNSVGQLLMKLWGYVQDATVGYGYRPGLAAMWFAGLLAGGTAYFAGRTLDPVEVNVHPTFNAFGYTLDLLIPLLSMGQDLAWDPRGTDLVVAYLLVFCGAVLATTVLAAVTRVLNRR